jgi:predicted dehydrogenase
MLRVGIVGAGDISAHHAEAYRESGRAEIVAWVDTAPARAKERAARFGGETFGALETMLETCLPDIVDICSPDAFHAAQAQAALRSGCHVLCEKPLALDPAQAAAVVDLAATADNVFMVGQVLRFFPAYRWIREFLRDEPLGKPFAAEIDYFLGCVERGEKPSEVPPEESLHSVAVVVAARESLESGGSPVAVGGTGGIDAAAPKDAAGPRGPAAAHTGTAGKDRP